MVLRSGPKDFGYTFVKTSEDEDVGDQKKQQEEPEPEDVQSAVSSIADVVASMANIVTGADATAAAANVDAGHDEKDAGGLDDDKKTKKEKEGADEGKGDTDTKKPFIYKPTKQQIRDNLDYYSGDYYDNRFLLDIGPGELILSFGACCCCMTALFVVAGAILFVCQAYLVQTADGTIETSNNGTAAATTTSEPAIAGNPALPLAGSILLILSAGSCLLGCCSLLSGSCCACIAGTGGALSAGGGGGGGSWESAHPEVKVSFKRHNDKFVKSEEALDRVHYDALKNVNKSAVVRDAEKAEQLKEKDNDKSKRDELERRVAEDLEAGKSVNEIRRGYRPIAFLIRFDGGLFSDASHECAELLRKQVSIVVNCGRPGIDRAVVIVTSPGGEVALYGLAASQLIRIRKAGIHLVSCVDTVAASGGYMMAAVADRINAAPFSIIGSIG